MTTLDWWFEAVAATEPPHIQIARRAKGRENVPVRVQEAIDRIRQANGLPGIYEKREKVA